MADAKHTPPPWNTFPMPTRTLGEAKANDKLAIAAPDLLDQAQAAVDGIREAVRIMDLMGRGQAARDLAIHQINLSAAIAKATGGA